MDYDRRRYPAFGWIADQLADRGSSYGSPDLRIFTPQFWHALDAEQDLQYTYEQDMDISIGRKYLYSMHTAMMEWIHCDEAICW